MSFPALTSIPSQLTDSVLSKMRMTAFFRMKRTSRKMNRHMDKNKMKLRNKIPVDRIELRGDENDWLQCVQIVSNKMNRHKLPVNFQLDDLCRVKAMNITVSPSFLESPFLQQVLDVFFGRVTCRELECQVETEDDLKMFVEGLKPSIVMIRWLQPPRSDILGSSVFENVEEIVIETDSNIEILCCHSNVQYLKVVSNTPIMEEDMNIAKMMDKSSLKRVHVANDSMSETFLIANTYHFETKSVLTIYNGDRYLRAKSREEDLNTIFEKIKENSVNGHVRFEDYDTDDEFDKSLHSYYVSEESFSSSDRSHLSDNSFL